MLGATQGLESGSAVVTAVMTGQAALILTALVVREDCPESTNLSHTVPSKDGMTNHTAVSLLSIISTSRGDDPPLMSPVNVPFEGSMLTRPSRLTFFKADKRKGKFSPRR